MDDTRIQFIALKTEEVDGSSPFSLFMSWYQYIKMLTVCVSVCLCVTEVGCLWGGTRL